jgi:hypothetical protein
MHYKNLTGANGFFHIPAFFMIFSLLLLPAMMKAQYEKNPLLPITNDGYRMTVEKFVQIPDDDGDRPRINCFTFIQDRIFVATEVGGRIYEIIDNGGGSYEAVLFFDVKAAIPVNTGRDLAATPGSFHSGLRSVAFHPGFPENGKFYTSVMEERPADTAGHNYLSDVDDPIYADGTVIEWTYDHDAGEVDENSYREIFRVATPEFDHPIKQISFNPYAEPADEDYGLLYVGHGDGNIYNAPDAGGQNNDGRGKILRIDPLETDSTTYSIPPTNPFVGDPDWLDEIFATGMRNPHSLCFARDESGDVYLISSNAGRENIEEINVVHPGDNHGWTPREGTYVQLPGGGLNTGIQALPDNEADFGYSYPAAQWSQGQSTFNGFGGISIVGGYVYHIEETDERIYLSADFPQSGMVMYNQLDELINAVTKLDPGNPDIDEPEELTQAPFKLLNVFFDDDNDEATPAVSKTWMRDVINDEASFDGSGRSDLRFGRDMNENIYITSKRNGWVYKIQSITPPEDPPDELSGAGEMVEQAMRLYPNPAPASADLNVYFNMPLKERALITLINTDGRVITTAQLSEGVDQYAISLGELQPASGYYLMRIESGSFTTVKPLVIH